MSLSSYDLRLTSKTYPDIVADERGRYEAKINMQACGVCAEGHSEWPNGYQSVCQRLAVTLGSAHG